MRTAKISGVEFKFDSAGRHGTITSLFTLQKQAIRKYLRMAKGYPPSPSRRKSAHQLALDAQVEQALYERDNWQLRITEQTAIISPLRVKMPLYTDLPRRAAQREIITVMAHSHRLQQAAKNALDYLHQKQPAKALAELHEILAELEVKPRIRGAKKRR